MGSVAAGRHARARLVFALLVVVGLLWLGRRWLLLMTATLVIVASGGTPASIVAVCAAVAGMLLSAWIASVRPRAGKRSVVDAPGVDISPAEAPRLLDALDLRGVTRLTVDASSTIRLEGGTLLIGFPLLRALRADELSAAGAFAGERSSWRFRFADWAARLAAAWEERAMKVARSRVRAPLHRRFMPWYAARLSTAASTVIDETWTELDVRVASEIGEPGFVRFLVQATAVDRRLADVHWPTVWSRTDLEAEPPTDVIESIDLSLERLGEDAVPEVLADRRDTFGELPAPRSIEHRSAADLLPADTSARLAQWWCAATAEQWREEYERGPGDLGRLSELDAADELADDDVTTYAYLVERFRSAAEARSLYERALGARRDDAVASFRLGALLLAEGELEGVENISHAMDLDLNAVEPGCSLIATELRRRGRADGAEAFEERLATHRAVLETAELERRTVSRDERLRPHQLDNDTVATLREFFGARSDVAVVYVARKLVRELADAAPVFVIGVVRRASSLRFESTHANDRLRNELLASLPLGGKLWMVVHQDQAQVGKWFDGVSGAEIYATHRRVNTRIVPRALPLAFLAVWLLAHAAR